LNATFGNATELIIALLALRAGLQEVVKASLTGSIIGNILLVLGLAMFIGGVRRDKQVFNQTSAGASAAMLFLAVVALVLPAVFDLSVFGTLAPGGREVERLSLLVAVVLFAIYIASLVFSLVTHKELLAPDEEHLKEGEHHARAWSTRSAVIVLLVATSLTAFAAEMLVGAIESATKTLGWTELFVGVIVVAVIGNAAEHFSAILFAAQNKMEVAMQIAIGSSTQIALLIAPLLVFASYLFGTPMSLVFNPFEIVAIALATLIVTIVALDGESNWFEGLQLLAVYVMMAIAFYFVPEHVPTAPAPQQ
ncbi:MAG: calcium/proton exchanger, partial [Chloroflexi bacterium]|nr:calcium/proton exchanger [Chloroflexota bacterium]